MMTVLSKLQTVEKRRPADLARIFYAIGRIWEEVEHNHAAAISMFTRADKLNPGYTKALDALERIFHRQGNVQGLILVYQSLLKPGHVESSELLVNLWHRLGDVYGEMSGTKKQSLSAYLRALELSPREPKIHRKLMQLYREIPGEAKKVHRELEWLESFIYADFSGVQKDMAQRRKDGLVHMKHDDWRQITENTNRFTVSTITFVASC